MAYTGKKPIDHTDVTQSQSMAVTDDLTVDGAITSQNGVYLGGTGSANKLDDYEEGTWTPTISQGAISSNRARYTKVGNLVNITASITTFTDRTSSNDVEIGGLPFTVKNDSVAAQGLMHRFINSGGDAVAAYTDSNSTTIRFYACNQNVSYTQVQHNHLGASSVIFINLTYQAA